MQPPPDAAQVRSPLSEPRILEGDAQRLDLPAPSQRTRLEEGEVAAAPAVGLAGGPRLAPDQLLERLGDQDLRASANRRGFRVQLEAADAAAHRDVEDLALRYLRPAAPGRAQQLPEGNLIATLAGARRDAVAAQRTVRPKSESSGRFSSLPHPGAWRAAGAQEISESPRGQRASVPHRPTGSGPAFGTVAFT